ncbi:hypothetical protein F511_04563 [Dorcoceras hygrometricum]|uniref:GYF domain-containing protein n=1 Tax=Dorcoceras hygrometricum TaxID=472368 RepID=A0A2Z7AZM7_9LAMI|nr:hypothetical protein F511_04563 [Dorcoceras hygrometricum]
MKDTFWVEEYSGKPLLPLKRKRRVGKKKLEFIGWGSRPLLEFLELIGEDTVKKHSQREVSEFITKYVHDKSLVKKNKRVECDEILRALFGRPSVSRTKIFDLLEEHFAENLDDSDDELLYSSEEENHKEKSSKSNRIGHKKKPFESPKSFFAAIIPENIRLVYLKRTLVQEFLKVPDSFECKLMGSFIRMKSDPNDIYQKNRFQLQQVTGVKMLSGASDAGIETCLQVSNHFKDVPICMLSDDNFSEEEMEDLRDRIKVGLLKKMTIAELNLKAKMLHEDITKHWIAKEISLLQKLIDHANEKDFTLFELLERRKLLQKPSEQEKLLATIPEAIAEDLVPDESLIVSSEEAGRNGCSPKSAPKGSDVSSAYASGLVKVINRSQASTNGSTPIIEKDGRALDMIPVEAPNGFEDHAIPSKFTFEDLNVATPDKDVIDINSVIPFEAPDRNAVSFGVNNANFDFKGYAIQYFIMHLLNDAGHENYCDTFEQVKETSHRGFEFVQHEEPTPNIIGNITSKEMLVVNSKESKPEQNFEKTAAPTEVIELSDDDSETEDRLGTNEIVSEFLDNNIWHYLDPQGKIQGPFSLNLLKQWSDHNYFHLGFKVWKTGQSQNEAVLLVDVLRQTFPS